MTDSEFSDLYTKHHRAVLNFVKSAMRRDRTGMAEDLAAESWLHAWRARDGWTQAASFRTWVCAIAMNRIKIYWRSTATPIHGGDVQIISLSTLYSVHHPDTGPMS